MNNEKIKKDLLKAFNEAKTGGQLRAAIYDVIMASINGQITDKEAQEILDNWVPTKEAEEVMDKEIKENEELNNKKGR